MCSWNRIFSILSLSFLKPTQHGTRTPVVFMLASDPPTSAYSGHPKRRSGSFGEMLCFFSLPSLVSSWEQVQEGWYCCSTGRRVSSSLRIKWKLKALSHWSQVLPVGCTLLLIRRNLLQQTRFSPVAEYFQQRRKVMEKSPHLQWKPWLCKTVPPWLLSPRGPVPLRVSREQPSWERPSVRTGKERLLPSGYYFYSVLAVTGGI